MFTKTGGVADLYSLLGRVIGQIEIYYSSEIGEGFRINHGVGTVIGARAHIGDNFTIHQNCTIGDKMEDVLRLVTMLPCMPVL